MAFYDLLKNSSLIIEIIKLVPVNSYNKINDKNPVLNKRLEIAISAHKKIQVITSKKILFFML
jgi:hypothetical protein